MLDVTATTTLLIDSLAVGNDDAAWSHFVGRYRPILIGLGRAAGLRESDAEDAAQQTLTEFARDIRDGRYDRGKGRLRSWLIGIARHRVVDVQRQQRRSRDNLGDHRGESALIDLNDDSTVTRIWEDAERAAITLQAIAELRTKTRLSEASLRVFELSVVRSVPVIEVARELGMTENDVYVAKSRVTSKLRELYAEIERAYKEDA